MITKTISQKAAMAMSIFTIAIFLCSMNVKAQYVEGRLYKKASSPDIYWLVYGQFHYVISPATFYGLFGPSPVVYTVPEEFNWTPYVGGGFAIDGNTCLTHDLSTGKIYFLFQNEYYHIKSVEAFYQYSFSDYYMVYRYGLDKPVSDCTLPRASVHIGCKWGWGAGLW